MSSLVILLAAAGATAPLRLFHFSCGHDFDFHLASWMDALRCWRQGIVYPHWTPSPNYGAGEPRFIFYPPLTWMLGAALGAVLPWQHVPLVLSFVLLAATGFATRALAREVLEEGAATLAGCFAICSAYALFTVYERSAYAELAGGFWIPLLLLFALREGKASVSERRSAVRALLGGSALPLGFVIAGAWLSNAPLGVMASYLLAAVALAVAALSRSWLPIVRAAVGTAIGLGLAAFYLVPAAWEQRWVDIRQATDDPGLLVQNSFLFGRHGNPQLEQHDIELFKVSCIAVVMVALALAGVLLCRFRKRLPGGRSWWVPLAVIPAVVLLLQLPVSLPLWNLLPKLRFLQFPWRWLLAVEAPIGVFLAAALWTTSRWGRSVVIAVCGLFFVASIAFSGISYHQECAPEDTVGSMLAAFRSGVGFEGTDEYAPPNADNSLVAIHLPPACLVTDPTKQLGGGDPDLTPEWTPQQGSCLVTFPFAWQPGRAGALHKHVRAAIPRPGFLVLHLRDYPAWAVRVNGNLSRSRPVREDGLMAVPVPSGPVDVTVDWTTTPDVRMGRSISGITLVLVLAAIAATRRQARLS